MSMAAMSRGAQAGLVGAFYMAAVVGVNGQAGVRGVQVLFRVETEVPPGQRLFTVPDDELLYLLAGRDVS